MPDEGASIGSVWVDVNARATRFWESFKSQTSAQASRVGDELGTVLGRALGDRVAASIASGIQRGSRDATRDALKAGAETGTAYGDAFKARVAASLKSLPAAKVDLDTTEADAKLDRLAARRVQVKVTTSTSGNGPAGSGAGSGNFLATLGGTNIVNVLQGAGIAAGAGSITPITAAVLGLGSAFASTGTAIAGFGVTAAFQIKQVADAMKLVSDKRVPLSELPADFQRIIPAVQGFQTSWQQFLATTRAPIFDVFAHGLGIAQVGLVQFAPVVNATSAGMSKALDVVGRFSSGPEVAAFLSVVRQQAPSAIESLARSATNLGGGLLNLFTGFAPAGVSLLHIVEQLTARFDTWSHSLAGSTAFQQFVGYAVTYGPQVVTTIVNIGVAVGKLVVGVGPLAAVFITALNAASSLLSAMPPQAWLAIAVAVGGIWLAFRGYAIVTSVIGGIQTLRNAMTGLAVAMSLAAGGTTALRVALVALTSATVVGLVITGIVAGLTALASHASSASTATRGLTADHQALAEALKASNGAIDDNVKKVAAQTLESKGLFEAGQLAGLNPKQVLDAYLAGGQQWQDVMDKLRAHEEDAWNKFYAAQIAGKPSGALKAQAEAAGAARKSADDLAGSSDKAAASNQREAQALGQSGGAAVQAASAYDRYTAAKQAALGVGTDEGQIAQDVTQSYNQLRQAVRGVADARYNEAQSAKSAAEANAQAARQIKDALESETAARRATQKAVQDLQAAREDAARKLRDQADAELSAKIALEKAQKQAAGLGLFKGPVVDDATIQKQQATLDLASAEHAYADAQKQSADLAKQGIDGQPQVLAAKQAVTDATRQEAKAHQAVADAYRNQSDTFASGAHARAAAHQATLDAIAGERAARAAYDASRAALDAASGAAGVAKDKVSALRDEMSKSLAMDTGDAQRQLSDVMRYLTAIKLLAANPTMSWQDAWNQAGQAPQPNVNASAQASRIQKEFERRGYSGGGWTGPGGKYEPAGVVHADEFVIPKETVNRFGVGHFMQYLPGAGLPGYAAGGPVIDAKGLNVAGTVTSHGLIQQALSALGYAGAGLIGSVAGIVGQVQQWLKSVVDPLPYVFGATGPGAFDCSGLVGDVWAALTGHARNQRWFVTGEDERQFLTGHGFKPGTGTFTVGFSSGHTMGNLAGLNFEAANHVAGIHVGSGTSNVLGFPSVYYLPTLGNQFVGSAGRLVNLPALYGFPGGPYIEPGPLATPRSGGGDRGRPVTGLDRAISALGGLVKFDSGGVLPPGITIARNDTGRNEFVLTGEQVARIGSDGPSIAINVYPGPDASPHEIAAMVKHELAWELGH